MQPSSLFLLSFLLVAPLHAHAVELVSLLPETVGEMHLIQRVDGAEAQAEVDKLHGKPLPAKASVIGRYARPSEVGQAHPAEVWISRVESEAEARRQTGLMVHKMFENPRSPFGHPTRLDRDGVPVYRFEGMGMAHLIWHKDDLVYWISVRPEGEEAMLAAFCR